MSATPVTKLPPIPPIHGAEAIRSSAPAQQTRRSDDFRVTLDRELDRHEGVTFSAHAMSRLLSRNISLTDSQISRLNQAVDQAATKGARDSLVMLDQLALIVSIQNRKVVTAVDSGQSAGNVFTQIDSAVIV